LGILIKDAESIELIHKIDVIVLDKTGTITTGQPEVTDILWNSNQIDKDLVCQILYTAESRSEHPLASAITRKLEKENIKTVDLSSFESLTGNGIKVKYTGEDYFIGNKNLLINHKIIIPEEFYEKAKQLELQAKTVVYFANSQVVMGIIGITDKIKENSKKAVSELIKSGLEIHLLTGDNNETARIIAEQTGIKIYKAEVKPGDKLEYIKMLQNKGLKVAMVGDGINDSPALAQANIGIAMGTGTDVAIESAGITLVKGDLFKILTAIKLSKKMVSTIHQNLFWAFFYNIIGIPIAAGVLYPINGFLLNPMIAGAAMAFSSVSVVLNSLRLKKY
jgi:P-type Cu2+ transporter